MRKLIVSEFLTLDGVMEASETWQPQFVTDDVAQAITADIHGTEASLYGRVTYALMSAYWPLQTHNEFGIADKLNSQPKYVVSSTLPKAKWNNTTVLRGEAAEAVRALKQQPGGDIRLVGSATLAQSLMRAGLVDEYRLLVHPIVRGHGKRLFEGNDEPLWLALVEATPFESGVVLMRYQPRPAA